MASKTYDQYCGIAAALDRVGDRWTLLVLRELAFGERRFTDLRSALPGVATNLLTERLRSLEEDGLVEQRDLPAPAARSVYALSDEGRRIVPVLRELARFGVPFLGEPPPSGVRPQMVVHSVLAPRFDPSPGPDVLARFDLDGTELWLQVRDGRLVGADRTATPDVVVTGSAVALLRWIRGEASASQPDLTVSGRRAAVRVFERAFHLPA